MRVRSPEKSGSFFKYWRNSSHSFADRFAAGDFARLVPWLMLNRGGLDVLVHPLAGNAYDDHTVYAMWLGDKLPLKLDVLKRAG